MTPADCSDDAAAALGSVLPAMASFGDRFVLDLGTPAGWPSSADLVGGEDRGLVDLVAMHAAHRGTTDLSDAASLFTQRYAHRLCAVTLGPWLVSGVAPRVDPEFVSVNIVDASPTGIAVRELRPMVGDVDEVIGHLVDDHLGPFVDAVRRTTRIGLSNLWGNVAAAVAGVFSRMSDTALASDLGRRDTVTSLQRDVVGKPDLIAAMALDALGSRPELAGRGEFVQLERHGRVRLFFERSTCCRWYRVPDGSLCSWCNQHEPGVRREIFLESLSLSS